MERTGRRHLNEDDDQWLATCENEMCDWSRMCTSEVVSKITMVCHTLLRHPDKYQEITGKDPEIAAHKYKKYMMIFKGEL